MSKIVFVGNVPFKVTDDTLLDLFKTAGHVVALRLVFDRETGRSKGYGFCEFVDHPTALYAVRTLNNTIVAGRPLRIDLGEPDPLLESKTTLRGEIVVRSGQNSGHDVNRTAELLASVPHGRPPRPEQRCEDAVREVLRGHSYGELNELLAQLKALSFTHPRELSALLDAHPQLAYAIYSGLSMNRLLRPENIPSILAHATSGGSTLPRQPQRTAYELAAPPALSANWKLHDACPVAISPTSTCTALGTSYTPLGAPSRQLSPPAGHREYHAEPTYQSYERPVRSLPASIPTMTSTLSAPGPRLVPYSQQPWRPPGKQSELGMLSSEQQRALAVLLNLGGEQLPVLSMDDRALLEQLRRGAIH